MRFILELLFFGLFSVSFAQQVFPDDWIGHYSGTMILGNLHRPSDSVEVELNFEEVIKDSVWSHKMTYKSAKFGEIVKDYIVRAENKGKFTSFFLDEQNGIVMPLSLMYNCFYGTYDVQGVKYINTLRIFEDGHSLFDLFAAPNSTLKSDRIETDEDNSFNVDSYSVTLHQTVWLKRL